MIMQPSIINVFVCVCEREREAIVSCINIPRLRRNCQDIDAKRDTNNYADMACIFFVSKKILLPLIVQYNTKMEK